MSLPMKPDPGPGGEKSVDESPSTATQGLSRQIAEFTVSLSLDRLPANVLSNAKLAILDCLGVSVLAAGEEIGDKLLRYARNNLGPGSCTVWGSDFTLNPRDAALVNGTLAHGLDFDDRGHASTYTLAAALAASEGCQASGARTLEAFIAGREAMMTLEPLFARRSSGIGPGARGWHSNGILGPIAAACAASKILDLDVSQTLTAIGLATGSCGALTRDGGTMAKPFRVGHAASAGLTCAYLAQEGFTSDETAVEGSYGLLDAVGPLQDDILEALGRGLGTDYRLGKEVKLKRFGSCTATHDGVEAMLRMVQENRPLAPSEIDFIECDMHPYPLVRMQPERGFEGRFSMAYCLSLALLYGQLDPESFTDERARDPELRNLLGRVRHVPGSDSLVVHLKDGTTVTEPVRTPADLKGREAVLNKFNDSVDRILSEAQRAAVPDLVDRLEQSPSIEPLMEALRRQPAY